jgi:DNA-binding CsgD family transcriptional regulator
MVSPERQRQSSARQAKPGPLSRAAAERLSDLIGGIYDCVLDPRKWNAVLEATCREFSFAGAILSVIGLRSGMGILQASFGFEPDTLARSSQMAAEAIAMWGGYERIQQYPIDEPIVLSQAVGYEHFHQNRYYREWGQPLGLIDQVAMAVARDPAIVGTVGLGRHESAGVIGPAEVDGLRLLAPHFRRAVIIGNLLDMKTIEAATFGTILDDLAFGIVLVDDKLGIVHANRAAQVMMQARDPIGSENGTLILTDRAAHTALQRAVRQAADDDAALGARGIGIPLRRAEGEALVVHVLPLHRGELRRGVSQRATAAIFVSPAAAPPHMPTDALALLYDLTPAEARVFELVVAGVTPSAIGQRLGIAPSTVKSHLLHLFEKTGCRRQLDLVRLAAGVSLPV